MLGLLPCCSFFYLFPNKFQFHLAQFLYGQLHVSGELGDGFTHRKGIALIEAAAKQRYEPAKMWLSDHREFADFTEEQAQSALALQAKLTKAMMESSSGTHYFFDVFKHLSIIAVHVAFAIHAFVYLLKMMLPYFS
ncbi:hypothetical protein BCT46_14980 [Vibrio sp. 10N.261.46.E8]|uniref:hypothetical protein n=1 Tax=unclassified Vibrio TaxID=2614977 RepID=UPI000976DC92|nr:MULTISPECIES: hypothetical protein [unclassified Vibrio]OMO36096.1 hypothetical protein BH584_04800 [Vibrio sp. 10N.261.45.E1]PML88080.1 hypothetical protein BCT66_10805 [Vibrio sp. 10N.261.49.E11]PMM67408.1 hypothetical protein BCT48_15280 [Vibrio sp. 10N.261.46.F12]PMN77923.1 hypothetical protein BCT22_20345 [Vibrio sp. 10N.261.45.A1]PMN91937.1 hypothetical protein BCT25_00930 [Vibrio sp. 10N.261.45.A6]